MESLGEIEAQELRSYRTAKIKLCQYESLPEGGGSS